MAVSYSTAIAIVQLVFFVPGLAFAVLLCVREGWAAASGTWRYIIILAVLRIAGAICQIISVSHISEGVLVAIVIFDLIGIAPLTLTTVGLLKRFDKTRHQMPPRYFDLIGLVSLVGLATGIAGAITSLHGSGVDLTFSIDATVMAAISMFLVCFAMMLFALGFLLHKARKYKMDTGKEKRILIAVSIASPLLLIRLIDAAIADYGKNLRFFSDFGDKTIYLCMAVLEEIAIMIICLVTGFLVLPPRETERNVM